MTRFAANTNVSVERSQEQIKSCLRRYGASAFGVIEQYDLAAVMFEIHHLTVRIDVPLPDRKAQEFTRTDAGRDRSERASLAAYEVAVRQRWRALLLAIKAKLEAVECGISSLETEFMPFMVMPDRRTLAQHILPRLKECVQTGRMPALMLPGPDAEGR